jgi:hypothetical protein
VFISILIRDSKVDIELSYGCMFVDSDDGGEALRPDMRSLSLGELDRCDTQSDSDDGDVDVLSGESGELP